MGYDKDELLEEMYKLTRANNKMLKRMRRAAWIGSIVKIIFWALMIGVPAWLYYQYAQPMIGQLLETMSQVQGAGAQLQKLDTGAVGQLLELLNKVPGI